MSHLYLAVINNGHLPYLLLIPRELRLDLRDKPAVNLLHDLVDTGKEPGKQLDRPLLQSLCHNGMVRISTRLGGNSPRLFPIQLVIIQQDPHQFRYRYRGMGIV